MRTNKVVISQNCITGNRSWLLVIFPRHKNNIVENIWCTEVTCHCLFKKRPHRAEGLIRLFQRKKLRLSTYDMSEQKQLKTLKK
jgi:hypothetical protein